MKKLKLSLIVTLLTLSTFTLPFVNASANEGDGGRPHGEIDPIENEDIQIR